MTAATTKMLRNAHRRQARSWALLSTPASSSDTSTTGNSNAIPKARIMRMMSRRYLEGLKNVRSEFPPT